MNKKLANFCTERGLSVDKNKAYGFINGYEVNVKYNNGWNTGAAYGAFGAVGGAMVTGNNPNNFFPIQIHISFSCTDTQKMTIFETVRSAGNKKTYCTVTPYGIAVGFNGFTVGGIVKKLPEQLDNILAIIKQNEGVGDACPVCGKPFEEGNKRTCNVDGMQITLDSDCVEKINEQINAENKEFAEAPNNYLFGFFGALIGGIVGGVLSILLYIIGFVASASAIVAAILGAFLYEKFHGKPNKMMIVIVSLTTIVCMALSVLILYIAVAGLSDVGSNAFDAFSYWMNNPTPLPDSDTTFAQAFYFDLGMVLVFSAVGIVGTIFYLMRKIKRKQSIQ